MRLWRLHLPLLILCAFAFSAPAQTPIANPAPVVRLPLGEKLRIPGVPNAGKISGILYRGAQPHQEGFAHLKELGIATIVDLRSEDPGKTAWERRQAESSGMQFVSIPVGSWSAPTDEQVAQFFLLLRDHPNQKVFVHCHFGEDRTGVFVAAYRMAHDQWTVEQAMKEMYVFGFNGFWHPSMKSYVRAFPGRLKTSSALAAFPVPGRPEISRK